MKKPQVVIVGRPNVGKSSLVNRLAGKRVAVVEEHRGVTRDRKAVEVEWNGLAFDVVDTGGWLEGGTTLEDKVSQQAEAALASADLVLLVVDVTTGMVDEDTHAARWALRSGRPVALLDFIVAELGEVREVEAAADADDDGALRVAIVGRPNVGKSTLFNKLIGEERSVVHDLPGTTRDAIDTVIESEVGLIRFIDTAGMRRRAKTEAGLETYAVLRSLDALDRADIAILVIDATIGATGQDQRLAERIGAAGCPSLVVLNKWELVAAEDRDDVLATVGQKLAFLGDAPVMKTTATSGKGVHRILPALAVAAHDYAKRVPTGALNRAIRDLQIKQPAPTGKIRYAVQGATEPPTFTLFVAGRLPSTYLRYVERSLRERFELGTSPLRVRVRVE